MYHAWQIDRGNIKRRTDLSCPRHVAGFTLIVLPYACVFTTSRIDALKQRKILAARGRARVAMDDAILHHRLGDSTRSVDEREHDAMKVLRPSSTGDGRPRSVDDAKNGTNAGKNASQSPDRRSATDRIGPNGCSRPEQAHLGSGETVAGGIENSSCAAGAGGYGDADADNVEAECTPTRPSGSRRPCSQHQTNRCLHPPEGGAGKTLVVLANVPTVAAATRTKLTRGPPSALFGRESSHSILSTSMRASQNTTTQEMPWPMGRRWW